MALLLSNLPLFSSSNYVQYFKISPKLLKNPWLLPSLIFLCGLSFSCSSVKSISSLDFASHYEEQALTRVYHRLLKADAGKLELQLRISLKKLPAMGNERLFNQKVQVYYTQRLNYTTKRILSVDTLKGFEIIGGKDNDFYLRCPISVVASDKGSVLDIIIKDRQSGRLFHHDVRIPASMESPSYQYHVFRNDGSPVIPLYLPVLDTFSIVRYDKQEISLFLKRYGNPYPAALPPFLTNGPTPKPNRPTESLITRTSTPIVLLQPGLYSFQDDSASRESIGVILGSGEYPLLTYATELVSPLTYMTSSEERKRLQAATNPKPELDKFFLELGGTKDNARRVIRNFYEHVEESNKYFTTFKEGWRSDMGLIFTIFGQPDKVTRSDSYEEWQYETNAVFDAVSFTFLLRPTIFNPEYYELMRYPEYERVFYITVDAWRKGVLAR